jgi:prepilin-type N-terminal cleavage/methylation domain-containing protein
VEQYIPKGEMMRNMKGIPKYQAGFTLIELMIALLVLALVIVGYAGANITAQRNSEEMHERTIAIQDASRLIEQMRSDSRNAASFPDDLVTPDYPENTPITRHNEATDQEDPVFNNLPNELTTVAYDDPGGNPLDATVTITWTSYTGRTHTEAVRTYITQR